MTAIRNYLNKKGQGIVEYAVLLAFIVGLAAFLGSGGIKDSVAGVFDSVVTLLGGGENSYGSKYSATLKNLGTMTLAELTNEKQSDRIAADIDGLKSIAAFFNQSGMTFDQLAGDGSNYPNEDGYLLVNARDKVDMGEDSEKNVQGSQILHFKATDEKEKNLFATAQDQTGPKEWMAGDYSATWEKYGNSAAYKGSDTHIFFGNEANVSGKEYGVNVAFTKDSDGNVTGTRVWVNQYGSSGALTATDENGTVTKYDVYVPKSK